MPGQSRKLLMLLILTSAVCLDGCFHETENTSDNNSGQENIQKGKKIVADLRTWATQINEEMSSSTDSFSNTIETTVDVLENDFDNVIVATIASIIAVSAAHNKSVEGTKQDGTYEIATFLTAENMIDFEINAVNGNLVIAGDQVTIANGKVNGATINLSATRPQESGSEFTFSIDESTIEDETAIFYISPSNAKITLNQTTTNLYNTDVESDESAHFISKLEIDLTSNLGHKQGASADPVSFSGVTQFKAYIFRDIHENGDLVETVNPDDVSLQGIFNVMGNEFTSSFNFDMRNADTFRIAETEYQEGVTYDDFASYSLSQDNTTLSIVWPDSTVKFSFDASTGHVTRSENQGLGFEDEFVIKSWQYNSEAQQYGYFPTNYESLEDFLNTYSQFNANCSLCWQRWVDDVGSVYAQAPADWNPQGGSVSATIATIENHDGETADNWRNMNASLQTTITFENMPTANFTFDLNRYAYQSISATFTIEYNGTIISVQGNAVDIDEDEDFAEANIVVTNSEGTLELSINSESKDNSGTIRVADEVVGIISPSETMDNELIVKFTNGDFETLRF